MVLGGGFLVKKLFHVSGPDFESSQGGDCGSGWCGAEGGLENQYRLGRQ